LALPAASDFSARIVTLVGVKQISTLSAELSGIDALSASQLPD
jgi:hypothetical protein